MEPLAVWCLYIFLLRGIEKSKRRKLRKYHHTKSQRVSVAAYRSRSRSLSFSFFLALTFFLVQWNGIIGNLCNVVNSKYSSTDVTAAGCCCEPAEVEGISHFLYGKDKLPFVHSFVWIWWFCVVFVACLASSCTNYFGLQGYFLHLPLCNDGDDDDDRRTQIRLPLCMCRRHHQRHRCRRRPWHKSHPMFLSAQPRNERGTRARCQ